MIDWRAIKDVIKPLFAELADLPRAQVRWRDEAEGSTWVDVPVLLLRFPNEDTIGIEEERREGNENGDQTVTVCAQKALTLNIRCESFQGGIDDPRFAGAVIARLKTRLARSTTAERLHGILGIQNYTNTTFFDYVDDDGRQLSVYAFDLLCLTVDNDVDTSRDAGGVIEEVIIQGTLTEGATQISVDLDVKRTP